MIGVILAIAAFVIWFSGFGLIFGLFSGTGGPKWWEMALGFVIVLGPLLAAGIGMDREDSRIQAQCKELGGIFVGTGSKGACIDRKSIVGPSPEQRQ